MDGQGKELRKKLGEKFREEREARDSPKFIRDPIHDLIKIEDEVILKVLNTAPVQRLRRIKQLGMASMVYPGADHSRFAHSLGVYFLSRRLMDQLGVLEEKHEYDRVVIQLAAILHDVGHGPFSHLFEATLRKVECADGGHESWSKKIIMEHPEVTTILDSYNPVLKSDVRDVIANTYKSSTGDNWLSGIVSSQFDADRLDYMMRDSHMTGAQYGKIDLTWLLRNLQIDDAPIVGEDVEHLEKRIVIDVRRGLSSLEEYLLGNLYLYEHVYYHKTVIAAETLIINVLTRAIDLLREGTELGVDCAAFEQIAANKLMDIDTYCNLDDTFVLMCIKKWADSGIDPILKDLSDRIVNRKLFKTKEVRHVGSNKVKITSAVESAVKSAGLDIRYYFELSDPSRAAYKTVFNDEAISGLQQVYCRTAEGNVLPFSKLDDSQKRPISDALRETKFEKHYMVFPENKSDIVREAEKGAI